LPLSAVVDNDVLIKGACYSLLAELMAAYGGAGSLGVLGTARYVVPRRLLRDPRLVNRDQAVARWGTFFVDAEEVEPTPKAIDLATALEEAAAAAGVPLDVGESLLCAVAIDRPVPGVVTGDKRAIEALELLLAGVNELRSLTGRVLCLEQLIEALIPRLGAGVTRAAVCAEPCADRALSLCFQCGRRSDGRIDPEGLRSYIGDLRRRAPTILALRPPF